MATHGWDKENGKVAQTGRVMCWKPGTERGGETCSASPQPQQCQPLCCILLARQLPRCPGITAVPGKPRFTHGPELQLPPTDPARAPSLRRWCCHVNAPWPVPGYFNNLHGHEDALSSSSCTNAATPCQLPRDPTREQHMPGWGDSASPCLTFLL